MYDVYVDERNGLLIVLHGSSIPADMKGRWTKK
jgi:hypothetical protein